jgi:hypothetical protein
MSWEMGMMKQRGAYLVVVVFVAAALVPGLCSAFTTDELEEVGVSFTGYFELLLEHTDGETTDTTDIKLEAAKFGFSYTPIDWVLVYALFDFGSGVGEVNVNEGYVSLGGSEALPVVITAGRNYAPMGGYASEFCDDPLCTAPLTKVLTETREELLQVGYDFGVAQVKVGAANGQVDKVGSDDDLNLYYGNVEVTPMEGVTLGASYTSSLANSLELRDLMPEDGIVDQIGGYSLYAIYDSGPIYGRLGYVSAAEKFDPADLDANGDGTGDEPSAWAVTVAYAVTPEVSVGAMYSTSDDMADFPEDRYGAVVSYSVYEGITLLGEYIHDEFYDGTDENIYQGRLKVSF